MTTSTIDADLWMRRYHPAPTARVRLVCLPHAGGSASYFHPVSRTFGQRADVICLQYPGRQDRRQEPCLTSIEDLADRIAECLGGQPELPTLLFGHSMGAVLGFETIRRLEPSAPFRLVASGRRGPATVRDDHVADRDDNGVIREITELNGTNNALLNDEEVLRMALPSIRADYKAIEAYRSPADRTISAPITVLTGDSDPKTTIAEAQAWEQHTTGEYRIKVFPGGHFFIAQQAPGVNAELTAELAKLR
jgi:surfactin synthase thioesterase subunit